MRTRTEYLAVVLAASALFAGCDDVLTKAPDPSQSFDAPIDGLTHEQRAIFARGDEAFSNVFTFRTGLGPLFNQASCERCHVVSKEK